MANRILTDEGTFSGDTRRKINANFAELYCAAASGAGGTLPTSPQFDTVTIVQDTISVGGYDVQVTGPTVLPAPAPVLPANVAVTDAAQTFTGVQTFGQINGAGLTLTAAQLTVGGHVVQVTAPVTLPAPAIPPPANMAVTDAPQNFAGVQTFTGQIRGTDPTKGLVLTSPVISAGGFDVTVAGPATIGGGPVGVTAGPFTAITSITVVNGLITAITGT